MSGRSAQRGDQLHELVRQRRIELRSLDEPGRGVEQPGRGARETNSGQAPPRQRPEWERPISAPPSTTIASAALLSAGTEVRDVDWRRRQRRPRDFWIRDAAAADLDVERQPVDQPQAGPGERRLREGRDVQQRRQAHDRTVPATMARARMRTVPRARGSNAVR